MTHWHIGAVLFFLALTAGVGLAASFRIPTTSPDYNAKGGAVQNFDLAFGVQVALVDGAITITEGTVAVTKAGVAALTLAAPKAGLPSAGGDDGRVLAIVDTTGNAHTITTPANAVNGAKHIVTFDTSGSPPTAAIGATAVLRAYGGVWYVNPGSVGITLS